MMTRIEFIKCMAVSPLIGCVNKKNHYRKAVKLEMFTSKLPFKEKFTLLKKLGYDGIEMNSESYNIEDIIHAAERASMKIVSVENTGGWSVPLNHTDKNVRDTSVKYLRKALEEALKLNAEFVNTIPGVRIPGEKSNRNNVERSVETLNAVLPAFNDSGVNLVLQNSPCGFAEDPETAAEILSMLDCSCAGICLDVNDAGSNLQKWNKRLSSKILTVHNQSFNDSQSVETRWKILDGFGGGVAWMKSKAG